MKIQKALSIFLLMAVLLLALAACGGSTSPSNNSSSSPATTVTAPPNPVDAVVTIFDNKIASSVTTFKAGTPYTFYVRNLSKKHQQFVILLSALSGSTMTQDQIQKASLVIVQDLAPDMGTSVDYVFPASTIGQNYQMISYLNGDFATGLKLPISVKK
jgi:hypothetical protein